MAYNPVPPRAMVIACGENPARCRKITRVRKVSYTIRSPRQERWLSIGKLSLFVPALVFFLLFGELLMLAYRGTLRTLPLVTGTVGAISLIILLTGSILAARRNNREARRQIEMLDLLGGLSGTLSRNAGATTPVMEQLSLAAGNMLQMPTTLVCIYDPVADTMTAVHQQGPGYEVLESSYPMRQLPAAARALHEDRVVAVEDTLNPSSPVNDRIIDGGQWRSMLIIPLRHEHNELGAFILCDTRPRRFSEVDRRMAEMMGRQASVIIANHRLYEHLRDSIRAQRKLHHQRETLYTLSAAIYQTDRLDTALRRLAELTPAALEADRCIVALVDGGPHQVQIAAITSGRTASQLIGRRVGTWETRFLQVLGGQDVLAVDNATDDPATPHILRDAMELGSVLYVPLLNIDHVAIGVLALLRKRVEPFNQEQRDLAMHFAARAAEALETARLNLQARRDADTKAMLLRELNHRVKNNLAGIVGLLSIDQPPLPAQARRWLARVTERVTMMARAHEMFGGGVQEIALERLVDILLPSLAVIKPPGVRIDKEMDNVRLILETDRAVSLLMALHELCWNAILYGLSDTGRLLIRTRVPGPGRIAIDVIDDGSAMVAASEPAVATAAQADLSSAGIGGYIAGAAGHPSSATRAPFATGMGLTLVRGLITRELRGEFKIDHLPEGGTVATINFPCVLPDAPISLP